MQKNVIRLMMILILIVAVTASVVVAQGGGAGGGQGAPGAGGAGGGRGGGGGGGGRGGGARGGGLVALAITTSAFADGTDIPPKFTGAAGVSPELNWTAVPNAMSYVLIMHDLDAANPATSMASDITHWVVWNIPGATIKLAENVPAGATLMDSSHQANNIAGMPKYQGPAPPAGAPYHHYIFQLYALNAMLDLPATSSRGDVEKALDGKIIARGAYTGKVKGN